MGEVDQEHLRRLTQDLLDFLDGDTDTIVRRLEQRMREAAEGLEYEQAARLRDRLTAVRKAIEKQQMVADRSEDIDVIGVAEDDLEAAVQVFVRRGRVVGRKGFVVDKVEDLAPASSSATCRGPLRRRPAGRPRTVLVPSEPDDPELYTQWLAQTRGGPVDIRVPQRGAKRELQQTVTRNAPRSSPATACAGPATTTPGPRPSTSCCRRSACPSPAAHRVLRHGPHPGHRLRGLDGGHGGRAAAQVQYRRFKVKSVAGNDDYGAMEEVLTRRLSAYIDERALPVSERAGKFAYRPSCCWSTGARASWPSPAGSWRTWGSRRRSPSRRWPSGSRRSTSRATPTRCGSPAGPRRSTCCSGSATRPTGSPTPTTASCVTSA